MEYIPGSTLKDKITQAQLQEEEFSEAQILDWFTQLCLGVKHLHERRTVHSQLNSCDIFISQEQGHIVDAGASSETLKIGIPRVGMDFHMTFDSRKIEDGPRQPPEMLNSSKGDVWLLGQILYELVALRRPFEASSHELLSKKIQRGSYPPIQASNNNYSQGLLNLIEACLQVNPRQRPSVGEILRLPLLQNRNGESAACSELDFSQEIEFEEECAEAIDQMINEELALSGLEGMSPIGEDEEVKYGTFQSLQENRAVPAMKRGDSEFDQVVDSLLALNGEVPRQPEDNTARQQCNDDMRDELNL